MNGKSITAFDASNPSSEPRHSAAPSPAPSEGDIDMQPEEEAIELALSQIIEEEEFQPLLVENNPNHSANDSKSHSLIPKKRRAGRVRPVPSAESVELEKQERQKKGSELLDDLLRRAREFMSGVNLDDNEFSNSASSSKSSGGVAGASKRSKRSAGRVRMTEKEEDDVLMHELEDELVSNRHNFVALTEQPSSITGKMRAYQLDGLNWMIRLYHSNASGILADEMGLGKTLQSISLLAYLKQFLNVNGPHLVLTPLSTLGNWQREFTRWCPSLRVLKFHGSKEERAELIRAGHLKMTDYDVCLTSYEMAIREKTQLNKHRWHFIVVDEAHRLKNENSLLSVIVRFFSSDHRLLITGTPLQNNLHELWALLNFLLPNLFSSAENFDAIFNEAESDSGSERGHSLLENLQKLLRPFMLRRLKTQVETDLPPKKISLIYTGLSELQRKLYRSILEKDWEALMGKVKERGRLMNMVMQLRKVADHPFLFDGVEDPNDYANGQNLIDVCGKMILVDKLLKHLKARQSRVLIFSQMTRMLDILEDYCWFKEYAYCRIDGNTAQADREEAMHKYNAEGSEKFIFLLSTRAGGLGINLYTADTVILYDSDWNPQMDLQAMDRAHRIGQKKQVNVFRLICEDTVEVQMLKRAEVKLHLDAMVIQQGKTQSTRTTKGISTEDLTKMIRYGADKIFRQTESTVSDEDIVNILERGEATQAEMTNDLKAHVNAMDFSLDGKVDMSMLPSDESTVDLTLADALTAKNLAMIDAMSQQKRERKRTNYNEDAYFSQAINAARGPTKSLLPKPTKIPRLLDHQLYDRERIEALSEKESEFYHAHQFDPNPPALKLLIEEDDQELQSLLKRGFGDWSFSDYQCFIHACFRYGRSATDQSWLLVQQGNLANLCWLITKRCSKRAASTSLKPARLCWLDYQERGSSGQVRRAQCSARGGFGAISVEDDVLTQYPFTSNATNRLKGFTETEDKFLLWLCRECGFGEWVAMHEKIMDDPQFSLDYWLLSRSPVELERRCTTLIREIERGPAKQRKSKGDGEAASEQKEGGGENKRKSKGKSESDEPEPAPKRRRAPNKSASTATSSNGAAKRKGGATASSSTASTAAKKKKRGT